MSQKTVSKAFRYNIQDWIYARLSRPSNSFAGLPPCPYAKKAWVDGAVKTHYLNETFPLTTSIPAEIENYTYHWPKNTEVVVLGFDPLRILPSTLSDILDRAKPMLDKRGYTALEDHPHEYEEVDGVWLNNGEYALVLLQETSKLIEARAWLEGKDYYKNWTDDYKEDVQGR
jgi:hypothetical protein